MIQTNHLRTGESLRGPAVSGVLEGSSDSCDRKDLEKEAQGWRLPRDIPLFPSIAIRSRRTAEVCTGGSSSSPRVGSGSASHHGVPSVSHPPGRLCFRMSEGDERKQANHQKAARYGDCSPASSVSFYSVKDSEGSDATCPEREEDADAVPVVCSSPPEPSASFRKKERPRATQPVAGMAADDLVVEVLTDDDRDVVDAGRKGTRTGYAGDEAEQARRNKPSRDASSFSAGSHVSLADCSHSSGRIYPPSSLPAETRHPSTASTSPSGRINASSSNSPHTSSLPFSCERASSRGPVFSTSSSSRTATSSSPFRESPSGRPRYGGSGGLANLIRQAAAASLPAPQHARPPEWSTTSPKEGRNRGSPPRVGLSSGPISLSSSQRASASTSPVRGPLGSLSPVPVTSPEWCSAQSSTGRSSSPASAAARSHTSSRERHPATKPEKREGKSLHNEPNLDRKETSWPTEVSEGKAQAGVLKVNREKALKTRKRLLEPIQVKEEETLLPGHASKRRYPLRCSRGGAPPLSSPFCENEVIVLSSSSPSPVDEDDEVQEMIVSHPRSGSSANLFSGGMSWRSEIRSVKQEEKARVLLPSCKEERTVTGTVIEEEQTVRSQRINTPRSSSTGVLRPSSPTAQCPAPSKLPAKRQEGTSMAAAEEPRDDAGSHHAVQGVHEARFEKDKRRKASSCAQPSVFVKSSSALERDRSDGESSLLGNVETEKENTPNSRAMACHVKLESSSGTLTRSRLHGVGESAETRAPLQEICVDVGLEETDQTVAGDDRDALAECQGSDDPRQAAETFAARPSRGRGRGKGQGSSRRRPRLERHSEDPESARRVSARVRENPFYGTAGKLMRVELKDFLNHKRLDWAPGSNCNVITGTHPASRWVSRRRSSGSGHSVCIQNSLDRPK